MSETVKPPTPAVEVWAGENDSPWIWIDPLPKGAKPRVTPEHLREARAGVRMGALAWVGVLLMAAGLVGAALALAAYHLFFAVFAAP